MAWRLGLAELATATAPCVSEGATDTLGLAPKVLLEAVPACRRTRLHPFSRDGDRGIEARRGGRAASQAAMGRHIDTACHLQPPCFSRFACPTFEHRCWEIVPAQIPPRLSYASVAANCQCSWVAYSTR